MDLAKHERAQAAQSVVADTHVSRSAQVRATSSRLIGNTIAAHIGKPEIEVLLAIGSVCPFGSNWDRAIWIEEANRLMAERAA